MLNDELKKLGFSRNLSLVYLKLIELGKVKAGELINQTRLQRSVVYSALDELLDRELISKVVNKGVAMFSANDSQYLIEENKKRVQLSQEIAQKIKQGQEQAVREVVVSEGLEAIMRATDRSLLAPSGETMYVLGASKLNVQPALADHWIKYHKKRIQRGIKFMGLYDHTVEQKFIDYRNQIELSAAKYLPLGLEMPIWFNICLDVVSIMVPGEDPPLVFTIRSKPTAEAIKKYFYYFWKMN